MTITLLQLAEKVLEEEKRALLGWEIWQLAKDKKIDRLVESQGKTPGAFLEASIDTDVRDNPSSIFSSLGSHSKRFFLKSQINNIRDKVRILEHVEYTIDGGIGAFDIVATKDSIGTKLYYEEYSDLINMDVKEGVYSHYPEHAKKHLAWVKSGVNDETRYPIRFEQVVPLSDDDYAKLNPFGTYHIVMSCQVGAISIVPTKSFEVI